MKYCFLGNMNNMAFVFAREMHEQGLDVTLFVDASASYILDRPESMDETISPPYPSWIKELPESLKQQIKKPFFLRFYKEKYLQLLHEYDVIILNGTWIRIGKYLKKNKILIALLAGYDLEILADKAAVPQRLAKRPIGKIWNILNKLKYRMVIEQQRKGIRRADGINYFPEGVNPAGDNLLKEIKKDKSYRRLQLRGYPFSQNEYHPFKQDLPFTILNFTRFFYQDFTRNDNKRNDLMIYGIADFIRNQKLSVNELKIVFFEKGPDVKPAKQLCEQLKISEYIEWRKEVSQQDLNKIIIESDVVFDQLGNQWLGYGIVAMALGRPVIANGRPEIFNELTGEKSPVCNAVNAAEVSARLSELYLDPEKKISIGKKSRAYILKHYDIKKTTDFLSSFRR